jgi:hypothetical protein
MSLAQRLFQNTLRAQIAFELLWWLFTAVLIWLAVMPIWTDPLYGRFVNTTAVYVLVASFGFRHLFFLRHTFLADFTVGKLALVVIPIWLAFQLVDYLQEFTEFVDFEDPDPLNSSNGFFRKEFVFLGVLSIITTASLPFRMVVSLWRQFNNEGV